MDSFMEIQLFNDRFTFKSKKMKKKIYVDGFVFLLLHIYRRHLSLPVGKICPVFNVPLIGENIIILVKN